MHFFTGFNTTHRLKTLLQGSAVATAVTLLASCGGSGGSSDPALGAALTGIEDQWTSQCFQVSSELSGINELTITADGYDQNTLFFVNSTTCSGQLIFLLDSEATYSLGAGSTITPEGVAGHIDINFGTITATATTALDALLALANTSFAELLSTQLNVGDANNINPEDLGLPSTLFSLIRVDGDTLMRGELGSNQGSSAETRLTELSTDNADTFTRQ